MKAVTLNFSRGAFGTRKNYMLYLTNILKTYNGQKCLVVLPGNSGLTLALNWGDLGTPAHFKEAYKAYLELPASWHEDLLSLHIQAARQLSLYIVCGTDILTINTNKFIATHLISPQGRILGCQKQLYLSREERSLEISRGDSLQVFPTPLGNIGLVIGTDAFYPEVGRILALKGAEIVCHCGALPEETQTESPGEKKNIFNIQDEDTGNKEDLEKELAPKKDRIIYWRQMSGMWSQVQQNQFFCLESQLASSILGRNFQGSSYIMAPCEMTSDKSGFLARGGPNLSGLPRKDLTQGKQKNKKQNGDDLDTNKTTEGILYSEPQEALLDFKARKKVIKNYPLLKLLNPAAYGPLHLH
ncbi:carbon-nitrogen hydrolase family protein [Candidatus Contubernalis alkaliaceticus]|uniref:carbon-nitrogen hydrolase family protein n=1 Tax=Candidatus Contubernalis alkaliaceticus TaxID=338645 RepID=UPI001F4BDDEF|nr:carbon-nitrogen hydrolase family protein [Candidatus Contubernalis alkalaceticus]UNC93306.1 carbon-nitrogen hydrolase family protein [Candidatus Contubernalis alkalaceticus]